MKYKIRKLITAVTFILILTIQVLPITVRADSNSNTIVAIDPTFIDAENGNTYMVNINVTPSMDIAGMQVSLNFDPLIVGVESVYEGNLFIQNDKNKSTYFAEGLIDNNNGVIDNITSVILGNYMVDSFGTFATIEFTAKKNGRVEFTLSNAVVGFTLMDIVDGDINSKAIPITINDYSNYVPPETTTTIPITTTIDNNGGSKQSLPSKNQSQGQSQEQVNLNQDVSSPDLSPASILAQNIIPILIVVFGIIFVVSEMMLDSTVNSLVVSAIGIIVCLTFLGIVGISL